MDKKMILWTLVVFFGCSILFRGIDAAVSGSKGMSLLIQALVMVAIIGAIVLIARKRR